MDLPAALLATADPLAAQNVSLYGSIVGNVADPSGAAVPGVRVTATNVATGIANSATSNNIGFYRIDGLITGTYTRARKSERDWAEPAESGNESILTG